MLDDKGLDKSTRKFIKIKTESANWFIDAIYQRKRTMLEIMNVIVKRQSVMFKEEKLELAPMILKDVATKLDIDISTVSRATNGKYVQLPWGIFEIKDFFSEGIMTSSGKEVSNTTVKKRVREIIDSEKKSTPLDDQAIVDILTVEGYLIARRTISKYRSLMGIPKAKLRREILDD
jgi:RNA polymerase sigma-54 factor